MRSCQRTSSLILNPIQASCHLLCSFIYISVQTAWTPEESFWWAQAFDTLEKRILGNASQARQLRPLGLYNYLPATSGCLAPPPGYRQTTRAVTIATFPGGCSPGLGFVLKATSVLYLLMFPVARCGGPLPLRYREETDFEINTVNSQYLGISYL